MAYFPFFIELEGKSGLIVGGGKVALGKIQKLLPYGPRLTVISPEISDEIHKIQESYAVQVCVKQEAFSEKYLEGVFFVITATDDPEVNHRISGLCQERGILVNVVDDREACGFLFPALIRQGELSIGVSTQGASPSGAKYIKDQIRKNIPEDFSGLLAYLGSLRPRIKRELPSESSREQCFSELFRLCMEDGWPVEEADLEKLLKRGKK